MCFTANYCSCLFSLSSGVLKENNVLREFPHETQSAQSLEKLEMASENVENPSVGEDQIIAVYRIKQVLKDLATDSHKTTKCN